MKSECVNPFLQAFDNVVMQTINIKPGKGNLYIKEGKLKSAEVILIIGVTGDLTGNVILNMSECAAKFVASKMMFGMEVRELDDMAKSAISELGNMIAGNSASFFVNIGKNINITPPDLYTRNSMDIITYKDKTLCVPININEHTIEIDISLN